MTCHALEHEQTYRVHKKKKVIPNLELSVKNKTLRSQGGAIPRLRRTVDTARRGTTRDSIKATQQAYRATQQARVKEAAKKSKTLSDGVKSDAAPKPISAANRDAASKQDIATRVRDNIKQVVTTRASLPPAKTVAIDPVTVKPSIPPREADTVQSALVLHELAVRSAEATARFNARITETLALVGKRTQAAEHSSKAQATKTSTIQRARQELVFVLSQIKADCQASIKALASKGFDAKVDAIRSRDTVQSLMPTVTQKISDANTATASVDAKSLQVYSTKNDLTSRLQLNDVSIKESIAKLELFNKRVDELSNMLTKVPNAINTQSLSYAVGALKGAIATLSKTAVKPSLVPKQISTKVTKLEEAALQRVVTAKAELAPIKAELTAPSALVKDLPGQKAAAKAEYDSAVTRVAKLDASTRADLSATVKAHEANAAALNALQAKLEPVKPPIINQTVVPSPADRNAAAKVVDNLKENASNIRFPDLNPRPTPPTKPEFTASEVTLPFVGQVRQSALALRTELDNAIATSAANRATFDNIQLKPEPSRAPIDDAIALQKSTVYQRAESIASANRETVDSRRNIFIEVKTDVKALREASNAAKNANKTLADSQRRPPPSKPLLGDTAPLKATQRETMDALENLQGIKDTNTVMLDFLNGRPIKDNGASLGVKALMRGLEINNRATIATISALRNKTYGPPRVNPRPDPTAVDTARQPLLDATGNLNNLRASNSSLRPHVAMLTTNRGYISKTQNVKDTTVTYTNLRNTSQTNVGTLKGLKETAAADKSGAFFAAESGIGRIVKGNFSRRLLPSITSARTKRTTAESNIRSLEVTLGASHNKLAQAKSIKLTDIQAKYDVITAVLVIKGNAQREITNLSGKQGALNTQITGVKNSQTPQRPDNPKPQEPSTNDLANAQRNLDNLQQELTLARESLANKLNERTTLNAYKEAGGITRANTKALEAFARTVKAVGLLKQGVKAIKIDAGLKASSVKDGLPTLRADAMQRPVPPLGQPPRPPDGTALTNTKNTVTKLTQDTNALKQKVARENPITAIAKKAHDVLTKTRETLKDLTAPVKTADKINAINSKEGAIKNADGIKDDLKTSRQDEANSKRESLKTLESIRAEKIRQREALKEYSKLEIYDKDGALRKVLDDKAKLEMERIKLEESIRKTEDDLDATLRRLDDPDLTPSKRKKLENEIKRLRESLKNKQAELDALKDSITRKNKERERLQKEADALKRLKDSLPKPNRLSMLSIGIGAALGTALLGPSLINIFNPVGTTPLAPVDSIAPPEAPPPQEPEGPDDSGDGENDGATDGRTQGEVDGRAAGIKEATNQYYAWKSQMNSGLVPTDGAANNSGAPANNSGAPANNSRTPANNSGDPANNPANNSGEPANNPTNNNP